MLHLVFECCLNNIVVPWGLLLLLLFSSSCDPWAHRPLVSHARWIICCQSDWFCCCCCCDSSAALLLSSVIQVEEVCNRSQVVPQVLHSKLRLMALTVEQMLYGVCCHSTLRTDIWYAAGDAGLVTVQKPIVTRKQLGESGRPTDWPRQQTFKRWDIGWWSSKDSGTKFVFASTTAWLWRVRRDSHDKCQHLWCLHLREVQPRCYTSSVCPSCFSLGQAEWWDDDTVGVIGNRKASIVWREVLSGI